MTLPFFKKQEASPVPKTQPASALKSFSAATNGGGNGGISKMNLPPLSDDALGENGDEKPKQREKPTSAPIEFTPPASSNGHSANMGAAWPSEGPSAKEPESHLDSLVHSIAKLMAEKQKTRLRVAILPLTIGNKGMDSNTIHNPEAFGFRRLFQDEEYRADSKEHGFMEAFPDYSYFRLSLKHSASFGNGADPSMEIVLRVRTHRSNFSETLEGESSPSRYANYAKIIKPSLAAVEIIQFGSLHKISIDLRLTTHLEHALRDLERSL